MIFKKKYSIVIFCLYILMLGTQLFAQDTVFFKQVKQIEFQGLHFITPEEIKKVKFKTRVGGYFSKEDIQTDMNHLYLLGKFKKISYETKEFENNISVKFIFIENPIISKISFNGHTLFTRNNLLKVLNNKVGNILNIADVEKDIQNLNSLYQEKGYDLFKVRQVFLLDDSALNYDFSEGFVGKIKFQGLTTIKPFVLRRAMALDSGSIFNSQQLRKDRLKILKLGYFDLVSPPSLSIGSNPNEVDILFNLNEKKVNLFDLGLETDENKLISFWQLSLNHLLLHSSLTSLKGELGIGQDNIEVQGYSIRHFQPWIFNALPISLALDGWFDVRSAVGDIPEHKRQGFDSILGVPVIRDRLTLSLKFKSEDIYDVETPYTLQTVSSLLTYSSLENWSNPQFGTYWTFEYEQGGDFNFIKLGSLNLKRLNFNWAAFLSPVKNQVLAIHGFVGLMEDDAISIESEQYLLGGSTSVRGYAEAYFSGSRKVQFNLEYRVDINDSWQWLIFTDAGEVFNSSEQFDVANLKIGKGLGLRVFTPVGPFRFDLGIGDTEIMLHFNIGQLF